MASGSVSAWLRVAGWGLALAGLLVVVPAVSAGPLGECTDAVHAFRAGFDAYRTAGNERWEELLPLLEEARRCVGDGPSALSASLADHETSLLLRVRRFDEADAALDRFFRIDAPEANPERIARMHQRRALLYTRMGRHAASLEAYARAGALVDRLSPQKGAELLARLGNRFRHLNELGRARRYYASADSLLALHYPADPALAAALGRVRTYQGALLIAEAERGAQPVAEAARQAQPLIEEALRLIPEEPDTRYERVQALVWLGIARRRGGDPAGALAPLADAQRMSAPVLGRYPHWTSWALSQEGHALIALGRFEKARAVLDRALAIDRESGRRDDEAVALEDLGLLEEAMADAGGAQHLAAAQRRYHEAIALRELSRQAYGTLEWSASVFEDLQRPYRRLARVLLRQGRAEEAFLTLDATRARYLRDLRASNRLRATLDAPRLARADSLSEALLGARYARHQPGLALADQIDLDAQIIRLQREMEDVIGFAPAPTDTLSVNGLQTALAQRGQALLAYFFEDEADVAFVVTPDTFAVVPLPASREVIQAEIAVIGPMWRAPGAPNPAFATSPLRRLHDALFAPVRDLLPPGTRLVIVPEAPIDALPFGMLIENAGASSAGLPFLVRRHPISTELAAALLLAEPPEAMDRRLDVLAFGRSRFEDTFDGDLRGLPLGNLPNVPVELARIRRRVGRADVAVDERATKAALLDRLGEARVLHLASHAVVNPGFPLYSFIALWEDPAAGDDGRLHLFELDGRPIPAELVVLSGCSTARGDRRLGEGMIGLQHAFRAAGTASTLATLWQVDDRAMAALMDRFYHHLRRGLPKDEALQRAQLDYLDAHDGLAASPFFWAAPVLYGDAAPLDLGGGFPWVLAGLLLVLAGFVLPRLAPLWRRVGAAH